MTVQGDRAVAYACDGNTIETWLQGTAKDGTVALTGKNDAKLDGVNSHHIAEAAFKAVERALREALEPDPRAGGEIPSTKGTLSA